MTLSSKDIKITSIISDDMIVDVIKNRKPDKFINDDYEQIINKIRGVESLGTTFGVTLADTTLMIAGVARMNKGLGYAWMQINAHFLKYPKTLVCISRQIVDEAVTYLNLHRIEADIDMDYQENIRFAKTIGFKQESIMEAYGPEKQDFARFVKIIR